MIVWWKIMVLKYIWWHFVKEKLNNQSNKNINAFMIPYGVEVASIDETSLNDIETGHW